MDNIFLLLVLDDKASEQYLYNGTFMFIEGLLLAGGSNKMNKFLTFGIMSVEKLSELLFGIGTAGIFAASWIKGHSVYLANTHMVTIKQGDWYTGAEVNNFPLGVFYGALYFIIGALLWRLVCELIYIVLKYCKTNTKEN